MFVCNICIRYRFDARDACRYKIIMYRHVETMTLVMNNYRIVTISSDLCFDYLQVSYVDQISVISQLPWSIQGNNS